MALDKNPERAAVATTAARAVVAEVGDVASARGAFERNVPSILACSDPLCKAELLIRMIDSTHDPVVLVDLDCLYSGYVESGMIQKRDNLVVLRPEKKSWSKDLSGVIAKVVSGGRSMVVVDSLNGAYRTFDGLDSVRFVNSCLMLLASIGRQTQSSVVITAMVRKNKAGRWVLSPGGMQLIKHSWDGGDGGGMFYVKRDDDRRLVLSGLGTDNHDRFVIAG